MEDGCRPSSLEGDASVQCVPGELWGLWAMGAQAAWRQSLLSPDQGTGGVCGGS